MKRKTTSRQLGQADPFHWIAERTRFRVRHLHLTRSGRASASGHSGSGKPSRSKNLCPIACAAALGVAILSSAGCVAKRGVDFGHWSRTPERIELVRVLTADRAQPFAIGERMLVLPPVGQGAAEARRELLNNILREIQYESTVHPFQIGDRVLPARYRREDNIADATGQFDLNEVVRIGRLFETRYVLCVHVRAWQPYAPQVLALHMTLVDVEAGERVAELNASFNAAEQQVIVAMDDWLQARRARKYDAQSLDIMLRSPSEFGAFATARCVQSLFQALKKTAGPTDT